MVYYLKRIGMTKTRNRRVNKKLNKEDIENLQFDLNKLSECINSLKNDTLNKTKNLQSNKNYVQDKTRDAVFRFFSVIDAIQDLVIIQDSEGKWKTVNEFGQKLFDLSPVQFIGRTTEELLQLKPYYDEIFLKCASINQIIWERKTPIRSVEFFNFKNNIIYFDIIKTPTYYSNGAPKELIIIGRDITESIKIQQRNKACIFALNSASDMIIITDGGGTITFCNESFLKTFKFNSLIEVENKTMSIINSGKMSKEFFKEMWTTIKSNKIWNGNITNKCSDGTLIECNTTILPVMNCEKFPIYYICTMRIVK